MTTTATRIEIQAVQNDDRYMRCASCRATASHFLYATRDGVQVTTEVVERHYIDDPAARDYVLTDFVTQVPVSLSTCVKHASLNTRKLRKSVA